MNNSPIGVFDSGMGGLSVWAALRRSLPQESLAYYGDGANCPYGEKPAEDVAGYVEEGVKRLLECGVKMVVLACNTATMAAINYLRGKYAIPFVGMEPAVKPAAGSTSSGVIGVLATQSTLGSDWFRELKERYAGDAKIITAEGEGFVRLVEGGGEDTQQALEMVRRTIEPMIAAGADRIVLGCTHYPFLADRMREVIAGRRVEIIDPAPAIVRRVEWLLDEADIHAAKDYEAQYEFLTAADGDYLLKLRRKAEAALRKK